MAPTLARLPASTLPARDRLHFWTHLGRTTRVMTASLRERQAVNPATLTLNAAKSRGRGKPVLAAEPVATHTAAGGFREGLKGATCSQHSLSPRGLDGWGWRLLTKSPFGWAGAGSHRMAMSKSETVWGGAEAQINVRTEHQPATRSFLCWELSSPSQPGSLFPSSRVLLSTVLGTTEESHSLIHA